MIRIHTLCDQSLADLNFVLIREIEFLANMHNQELSLNFGPKRDTIIGF